MQGRLKTLPIAVVLFFCSGALGLGYELVWIRKAALVVGASQIALATVLTSFFIGIALGSRFFGRYPSLARRSPLVVYGLLELAIGVYAIAFPALFDLLKAVYGAAYPLLEGTSVGLFGLRFILLFLLFLLPTFFMGGTLPLLLDGLVARDGSVGPRTSLLYGINILGAVVGVLGTGYLALPWLGMNTTSVVGGVANLLIGAVAIGTFRDLAPPHRSAARVPVDRFFPAAAFAVGLLAIAYQICWVRYFTLFNFSTAYLTAMLLAIYLLSLALGSFALAPMLQARWHPLRIIGFCQALVPAAVVLCLGAWRLASHRFAMQMETTADGGLRPSPTFELAHDSPDFFHFLGETADAVFFAPLFQASLVMLLPVLLIGTALPALIAAAARRAIHLRSVSGQLVFWNTLGSSAGGFLAGYVILPLLGLHWSLALLGLGSLGMSLAATLRAREPAVSTGRRRAYALPAVGLVALAGFCMSEDVTRRIIRLEQFPTAGRVTTAEQGRDTSGLSFREVVEGPLTTAYVTEDDTTLRIGSGFVQMGYAIKNSVNTQTVAGHIPAVLYPGTGNPQDALGICLGSGQSFGALLRHPIERLDIVEISGEIAKLALEHFKDYNNHLGEDPRVTLHLDDGRHFVERAADASYDLISMESPPPTSDGVHSLYSVEFYEQVRRILRPDGVYMQFMPLYFLTPMDAKSVIRTMSEVFPETFVAKVTFGDFVLLGYPRRPTFVTSAIRRRALIVSKEWASMSPPWGKWAPDSAFPIASFEGIASLLVMGPEYVELIDAPEIYHDDRQLLSYSTGDRWLSRRYGGIPLIHLTFAELPLMDFSKMKDYFEPPLAPQQIETLRSEQVAALWNLNIRHPREIAAKMASMREARTPLERAGVALELALDFDATLQKVDAFRFVEIALESLKDRPELIEEAHRSAVRKIVRNRLAVYDDVIEERLRELETRYTDSPLVEVIRSELEEYRLRCSEAESRYLLR